IVARNGPCLPGHRLARRPTGSLTTLRNRLLLSIGVSGVLRYANAALREAAETIDRMPSTFMTDPMGGRILPVERGRTAGPPGIVRLDADYLTAFGWMRVPGHLWRAMRRNAAWIEPTLIAEWMRLIRDYARYQNRSIVEDKMFAARPATYVVPEPA